MIRLSLPQKKGGVGKTTLVRILADWFARRYRVLLVDFDDQCSLSSLFLPMERVGRARQKRPPVHPDYDPSDPEHGDWTGRSSSADVFYPDRIVMQYQIARYGTAGLDILPADSRELVYVREKESEHIRTRLERNIVDFFLDEGLEDLYDLILFDTGPSESPLMRGVIGASTHTIIPAELEQQCVDGLDAIVGMVIEEQERRARDHPLDLACIQINKYQKVRSLHQGFLQQIQDTPGVAQHLSPVLLPNRTAFAERDVRGLLPSSLFDLRPSDPSRKTAEEWCRFIEKQLFNEERDCHAS